MTKQTINRGTAAGDGTGENLFLAFGKAIANFTELYDVINGVAAMPNGQLKFPAAQNPSADPNTLDDYEEGTYTPSRTSFTEVPGAGSITAAGSYTKLGRLVFVHAKITPAGGATIAATPGSSNLGSLPFAPIDTVPGTWINTSTEAAHGSASVRAAGMVAIEGWTASGDARSFSSTYQTS